MEKQLATKKVLIADLFSQQNIANLRSKGFVVHYDDKLNGDALKDFIAKFDPHIIVVRSTKVTAAHLKASPSLEVVIRAGSGVDTIDIKTASEIGVSVANVPGKNADAVAEVVLGLLLAIDRRIPENVIDLRNKKWNKGEYSKAQGLKGRTVGIIGFGFIGHEVATRAAAFGMEVCAYDTNPTGRVRQAGYHQCASIDELLSKSDVVTVHIPANASTKGIINKAFLNKMKKDAILINASRGDIVVESDLIEHLNENKNFKFGSDVFVNEPADKSAPFDSKLASHPKVYGTHHIGASTSQAEDAIGNEAYRMIIEYAGTTQLPHCVNLKQLKPRTPKPKL